MPDETRNAEAASRRAFLKTAGTGIVATGLLGETVGQAAARSPQVAPPAAPETRPIPLPPTSAATERPPAPTPLAPLAVKHTSYLSTHV